MAFTNAWDESTPLGSEVASTLDNYQRKHRLDLGQRLEDMFYGFNAASNAAPENDYGVKSLRFYKQTSDPTAVTDYAHFYVKLVDGVPELFYQDDENTTLQLTSAGNLKSTAGLVIDGNGTVTGTLGVTGIATLGDASLLATSAVPTADAMITNKKYVDDGAYKASDGSITTGYRYCDVQGTLTQVFTKYLTGTLDSDASTSVAHNLTATKILSVNVICYDDSNSVYRVAETYLGESGGVGFTVSYDATNIIISTVGADVQGNAYRIKIEYTV